MATDNTMGKECKLNEKGITFVCPLCKKKLLKIDCFFECDEHGSFELCKGIPVLIKDSSGSDIQYFEEHWKKRKSLQYAQTKLDSAKEFIKPIGKISKDTFLLDAGCGDGVHANVICKKYANLISYYGVDISLPALFTAKERNSIGRFVNSDIEYLPFENNSFDVAISYGVLAYTPSPDKSFAEFCRVTKRGGLIGVWFYPKPTGLFWYVLKAVRDVVRKMPVSIVNVLANLIVPFLFVLPTSSKVNPFNASWEQCKEVVLVNIAPKTLWYPKKNEILTMFKKNNIAILDSHGRENITVWGVKK